MKTKKFFKVFSILIVIAFTVTTVLASPYEMPSFWMADPLDPGHPAPPEGTDPSTAVEGYWWRDTTNQNIIAQHSEDQFNSQAYQIYISSKLRVIVYASLSGANTTAIVSTSGFYIVGPGGGRTEAMVAKNALQRSYPSISTKNLLGVIYTGASPQETWGSEFWRFSFYSNPLAPVYAGPGYTEALAERTEVETAIIAREDKAYGRVRGVDADGDETVNHMAWGPDGFLGLGSMKNYRPETAWYADPTNLLSEETTLYADTIPVTLIPTPHRGGGLLVWLPNQKVLLGGDFGQYLPDAGSINQPSVSIPERINALNQMINLGPLSIVPVHGMYISGNANLNSALTAQRDALQSIYDQTLVRINAGDTIDEAVAAVALPANLVSSPYNQELVSTIPGIVRNLYHEKLGWFGGETLELTSTLTSSAEAQILADLAGGLENLTAAARQAELNARDLAGAEKALYLAHAAYTLAPEDFTVKQVYAQALRKNAFMQKSAQIRNYYLMEALSLGTEQIVTDFTKTGDEEAAIAFTAAEFAGNFMGIGGATLSTVKIVSLPPAENGALTLPGMDESGNPIVVPVAEGQEIQLADLDGLVFTPLADWNGSTSFLWNGMDGATYAAYDATITLTINPVNDAPTLSDTPLADVTVDEDALSSDIDLSTGFNDVDGEALTYTVTSSAAEVSATVNESTLTLTYQANWSGSAAITITATDAGAAFVSDEFTVTVNPVNDAPTAADAYITVVAGKSQTITLDYGDVETAQANLTVSFGTLNGTLDYSALPSLTYTAPSIAGDDSFTYTVTDRGDPDGCSAAPCAAPLSITPTVHVTVLAAPSASISGVVFNDANANGSLDGGEGGLAGVVVQLQDASGSELETFTTGADGAYTFTALDAGSYQVYAPKDADRVQTTQNPIAVTLAEAQAVTGVNIGSVVSADLKVSMTYTVNSKKIIYAITITNDGPADALSAALTDVLPNTVAYISVISTQGTCSGGKTVNCDFGTIASGGSVTVTIQVNRINTKIAIVNTVTVTSSIFDIDIADNIVTNTVQ